MKIQNDQLRFSATDLVGYLNCRHLSGLEHAVAKGELVKPKYYDPLLEALWERGAKHEQDYVEHLASLGLHVVRIDGVEITDETVAATHEATLVSRLRKAGSEFPKCTRKVFEVVSLLRSTRQPAANQRAQSQKGFLQSCDFRKFDLTMLCHRILLPAQLAEVDFVSTISMKFGPAIECLNESRASPSAQFH